ncbi:ribosome maturation factor RimP [Clostridioides difficile]|uniref:ribosome maturation factor RimP n=1 Tax=Clostridioides difficile TaxID=1496 RepID=UPI000A0C8D40|nr:ribosome maturation factor RimP [Clostridioides difficile]VHS61959.1 ribosome maturation factor RimP [Clostridioides difficile]
MNRRNFNEKNLEATIEEIVTKITDEHGFEMVDVEYVKEAGEYYLRVYIDKEEGISLNECELVSRELSPILDEKDPIKENYFLEVSSPGLDRALKKDRDFVRYQGRDVDLKLYKPLNGCKQFEGELVGLTEDNNIKIIANGKEMEFNRKDVAIVRLAIKF